jgi:hypothetical protein
MMKTPLRTINEYDIEQFKDAAGKWIVLKPSHHTPNIELDKVCGKVAKIELVDGHWLVEWEPINTPVGDVVQMLPQCVIRPVGTGILREGKVSNYTLMFFSLDAE